MITWWAAVLLAFGFTIWSLFCILVGAALATNADKKLKDAESKGKGTQQNPKLN